jgi:carboxypeptidase PM20D1
LLDFDVDQAATRFARALTYQTVSYQAREQIDEAEFERFRQFLKESYPRIHTELQWELVNGASLFFKWSGQDPGLAPMMLVAHQDVVPVADASVADWTYPPFGGMIDNDIVWGRGALDMKSSLVAICEAVEQLLAQGFKPRRTVYLGFGHDEEVGGEQGAGAIARLMQERGLRASFILDEGGAVPEKNVLPGITSPVATIGIAEKGYLSVKLIARGQGGHSSTPPRDTAISKLARALVRLDENPLPETLEYVGATFEPIVPLMPFTERLLLANFWLFGPVAREFLRDVPELAASMHTTLVPTLLQAGVKENVIPYEAAATLNLRILPGDTITGLLAYLEDVIDDDAIAIKVLSARDPSPVASTETPDFLLLKQTILQMQPDKPLPITTFLDFGGTDLKNYYEVTDNQYRFAYHKVTREILDGNHGINEHLPVSNFADMVRFYYLLIRNLAGQ